MSLTKELEIHLNNEFHKVFIKHTNHMLSQLSKKTKSPKDELIEIWNDLNPKYMVEKKQKEKKKIKFEIIEDEEEFELINT